MPCKLLLLIGVDYGDNRDGPNIGWTKRGVMPRRAASTSAAWLSALRLATSTRTTPSFRCEATARITAGVVLIGTETTTRSSSWMKSSGLLLVSKGSTA